MTPAFGQWWSDDDVRALGELALAHDIDPEWLAIVMFSESGLNPGAVNGGPSSTTGARGLIQFLPSTLRALFAMSDADIASFPSLSVAAQLPYVSKFLSGSERAARSHMQSAGMLYQGIFYPASYARGGGPDVVIVSSPAAAYTANAGLDANGDGTITVGDLEAHLNVLRASSAFRAFVARIRAITQIPPKKAWTAPVSRKPVAAAIVSGMLAAAIAVGFVAWRVDVSR